MLFEILQYLRNWFSAQAYAGEFVISNGKIDLTDKIVEGQYFRILGSALNDGVWLYPAFNLKDESFSGAIWTLRIPPDFLALVADIEKWQEKYAAASTSPYQSESFENYSYSKATSADGNAITWQTAFAGRLAPWRKA